MKRYWITVPLTLLVVATVTFFLGYAFSLLPTFPLSGLLELAVAVSVGMGLPYVAVWIGAWPRAYWFDIRPAGERES